MYTYVYAICMCVQAMLMTLYSEFLLTLQIIFRLRRKCNFGGRSRPLTPMRSTTVRCYMLFN